jgi:murein DD-endopeptidase MepM/ murein hydrolase activator NlpD
MLSPVTHLRKRRVNRTLHGRSRYRQTNVPGHNIFKGFSHPGIGDGVDLFGPAGEEVFSPFAGVVYSHGADTQTLENVYLHRPANKRAGVSEAWAVMAHIDTSMAEAEMAPGTRVEAGQLVGQLRGDLKDPHLHFELWLGGAAVNAPTPAKLRNKIADLCGLPT